eukprot:Sspe_Gene.22317::Locus_8464_Transcript_2_3_Confidence_0.333_Length_1630::g.22317::m.22317
MATCTAVLLLLGLAVYGFEWRLVHQPTPPLPGALFEFGVMGYDPTAERLVAFTQHGEAFHFRIPANQSWERLPVVGDSPPQRRSAVYGEYRGGVVMALGQDGGTFYQDVWHFNYSTDAWTALFRDGHGPAPRYGSSGGVRNDILQITHGFAKERYSDTWEFNLLSREWTRVCEGSHEYRLDYPHARCLHAGVYGESKGEPVHVIFGGCLSGGKSGGPCPAWDAWCLRGGSWERFPDGLLPSVHGTMVMLGGMPTLVTPGLPEDIGRQYLSGSNPTGAYIFSFDCESLEFTGYVPAGTSPPALSKNMVVAGTSRAFVVSADGYIWELAVTPTASPTSRDVTFFTLPILHGVFMFLAWGVTLQAGVFIAANFRHRDPLWFKLHRAFQMTGMVLALVGFAVIIPGVLNKHFSFAHGAIGLVVTILGILQPVNAYFRPHKGDGTKRVVWEYLHKGAGRLALVLGLVNIVLGVVLITAPYPLFIFSTTWCCVVAVAQAVPWSYLILKKSSDGSGGKQHDHPPDQ